jgi:hypothetical protein
MDKAMANGVTRLDCPAPRVTSPVVLSTLVDNSATTDAAGKVLQTTSQCIATDGGKFSSLSSAEEIAPTSVFVSISQKPIVAIVGRSVLLLAMLAVCTAARANDVKPDDAMQAVFDRVKKMSPAEQQTWLAQLEQRAARAARLTLSPEDAAKQQAHTRSLLHQKVVTWQVMREVIADTEARERAAAAEAVSKVSKNPSHKSPLALGEGQVARAELAESSPHPSPLPKGEGTIEIDAKRVVVKPRVAKKEIVEPQVARPPEVVKVEPEQPREPQRIVAKPQAAKRAEEPQAGKKAEETRAVKPQVVQKEIREPEAEPVAIDNLLPGSVKVNVEELEARIAGCNLAFREFETELGEKGGVWNAAKIEPLLDRLKILVLRHNDLELVRNVVPKDEQADVPSLESPKTAIDQFKARVGEARNRANDAKSGSEAERRAELGRLDAISRKLAEFGGK